ncbi:Thermostable monoacylglycerol lipase [Paraliobacillus sp. PM-2]|uniref:alpha/beta hydrolase n=1 Tax=Paraliobacillus sp. PM-2 TaxID=1462524 RepID=UPI00061C92CF|nr:alpha/beta fold hydrolase [Paraliobacillus sp. PM-2]CQR48276.1 Thermostable monoacylglycerol lipase [Paraliobacillus sp. PM-2]
MIGCLCIHGFTGGLYEIEPLVTYLKKNTDWIIKSPTLPGHGIDLALDDVSYTEWIQKAEQALIELKQKVDIVYVIGFSMGGMIASYLASKYNVAKLVLLSPSRRYINVVQMGLDIGDIIKDKIAGRLQENVLYKIYQHKRGHIPIRAYIEFLKCMKFTKPALKNIFCPVFVAQGIQDGMVPYTSTHYLDEEIPTDIEAIYYSDSKHHICLGKDKDVVNEAVLNFLNKAISTKVK